MAEPGAVVKTEQDDLDQTDIVPTEAKLRYKSWRKKYRKMRLQFDDNMDQANKMFLSEHKARNIARRLQEDIDQILELLLEVNVDPRTPAQIRWDLGQDIAQDKPLSAGKSLQDLEKSVTHTASALPDKSSLPADLVDIESLSDPPPSYLSLEHEEEYLAQLDTSLLQIPPTENLPLNVEAVQPPPLLRPKPLPTEKDFQLQNPLSTYNWLKRNQPQVFDQPKERIELDHENRAARGGAVGKGKKDKHVPKQELPYEDLDDDIGFDAASDAPAAVSGRGKKKNEDNAYRPKGGASKATKRKREKEDASEVKSGKKAKKSSYYANEEE